MIFLTAIIAGGIANPPKASCLFPDKEPAAVKENPGNPPLGWGWLLPDFLLPEPGVRVSHLFSVLSNCYWASMMMVLRLQQGAHLTRSLPSPSLHCSDVCLHSQWRCHPTHALDMVALPTGLLFFFRNCTTTLYYLETFLRLFLVFLLPSILKLISHSPGMWTEVMKWYIK